MNITTEERERILKAVSSMLLVLEVHSIELDAEGQKEVAEWLAKKIVYDQYRMPEGALRIVYKMNPAAMGIIERHITMRGGRNPKYPELLTHTQTLGYGSEAATGLSQEMVNAMEAHKGILVFEL